MKFNAFLIVESKSDIKNIGDNYFLIFNNYKYFSVGNIIPLIIKSEHKCIGFAKILFVYANNKTKVIFNILKTNQCNLYYNAYLKYKEEFINE